MEYPDLAALPQELRDTVEAHNSLNVYRMITHSPGLAPGFFVMADAMFQANSLPAQLRELAIIRVGRVYGATYEVFQHERIGGWVGLSADAIAAAATGSNEGLPDDEAAILGWTDQLLETHTLGDSERDGALKVLGVTQLADLVLTVGFYQLVCNFLNTFDVTTEGEPTFG
jgi:4-carboxymuconolactone decarboxylase